MSQANQFAVALENRYRIELDHSPFMQVTLVPAYQQPCVIDYARPHLICAASFSAREKSAGSSSKIVIRDQSSTRENLQSQQRSIVTQQNTRLGGQLILQHTLPCREERREDEAASAAALEEVAVEAEAVVCAAPNIIIK